MDEKERQQYRKLVLTPVNQLIPRLAIPTVISMMITMIYNLVDAFFVGKLGTSASASIGILASVQAIFQAIGFMFGHGSGSVISLQLGKGEKEEADKLASLGFFSAVVFSILPAVLGFMFLTPLMRFLGSTETILPYARSYGFYILLSGPAMAMSCVLNNIMRYEGKAFYAMIGLVSGGVLNMIGDPILMFGFHMGINGAGLSTALSQYFSLALLYYMFASGRTISHIRIKNLSLDADRFLHIIKNGFPSLIRQSMNSVSSMTLNICANLYGDAAIAAMSIVGRIAMFIGSAMIGIGQGFQPVSSFNYGARKYRRIRDAFRFTFLLSEVVLGILAVLGFLFPEPIVAVFRNDPEVIAVGVRALRFQCIAIVFQPIGVITNMLFQSIGKSRTASFTAALRSGLYYIPALMVLPLFFGITGIESAQMCADLLTAATCLPFVAAFFRTLPRADEPAPIDERYRQSQTGEKGGLIQS